MALTFANPPIRVRYPSQLYAGGRPGFELVLRAAGEPQIGAITVRLLGIAGWLNERHVIDTTTTVIDQGPRRLSPGEHVVPIDLTLPRNLPPSIDAPPMWSYTRLLVEVRRPRWFTARTTWLVDVVSPPQETSDGGVTAEVGDLSAALPRATLTAGRAFALDVRLAAPRATPLRVTGMLVPRGRIVRSGREVPHWLQAELAVPTVALEPGATAVSLRGYVAPSTAPSFATPEVGLDWRLRLLIDDGSGFATDHVLDLPVAIVAGAAPLDLRSLDTTTDAHLPEVWRSQAHRAGRVRRLFAVAAKALELEVEHAGDPDGAWRVALVDRRVPFVRRLEFRRDDHETALIARLADLQLGLGLQVSEPLLPSSSDLGRSLTITARERAQAEPITQLARAVPTLGPLAGALSLDDAQLELRLPALPIDEARVVAIARHLSGVAQQFADARERLAPPASVAVDRAAWSGLASELGSVVRWGNLAIVGARFGRHVAIELAWADDVPRVVVRVAGPDQVHAGAARLVAGAPRGALDAGGVPPEVRAMVAAWPADFDQLELRAGDASACLRLADAPRPPVRADRVRDLVIALAALLDALGPAAGPYR